MAYELGAHINSNKFTAPLVWKVGNAYEGVSIWARQNSTGQYVRVYEVAAEEYVQGEPQSWSRGNFDTVEAAKREAGRAYRYLNRRRGH